MKCPDCKKELKKVALHYECEQCKQGYWQVSDKEFLSISLKPKKRIGKSCKNCKYYESFYYEEDGYLDEICRHDNLIQIIAEEKYLFIPPDENFSCKYFEEKE